ncbi:MAG: TrkA family potassium uptake protein [Atopobiaceae bacterium]|nr:TrkA family potassium uptake protein [Atopobiaceae bacterium]MDO4404889.1 TrkA family potassium uptake protein [Atopobiaceae bacterium]
MKTVLLIGLGRFGTNVAMKLNDLDHEVMAVDCNEERVDNILPFVTNAQIGDSTNEAFLETLDIQNYDVCFVAIAHNFQSSLETTSLIKEMGAKFVVARAESDIQRKFLLRNGADAVVYPEAQMARWAAIRYSADHILDYIELDEGHSIVEVSIPQNWAGKTLGQIDVRQKHGVNILALKRGGQMYMSVKADTVLTTDCTLLVLGETLALQRTFDI